MLFENALGQKHLKNHLITSADSERIPHAQLFVGPEGCGILPIALAYAQYLISKIHVKDSDGYNNCLHKCATFTHPDIHFAFPVSNSDKVKSHAVSDNYLQEWRQFLSEQPYGNLFDWYRFIGIEKKQGQIGVDEAQDIVKKLSLKSYEGGYKVLLVWMAEKMNTAASNKLLKLIEEPPRQTIILLLAEEEEQLIGTIRSRCQVLHFPHLPEDTIAKGLREKGMGDAQAQQLAHEANGNYNKALDLMNQDSEDLIFEKWFVQWVRSAFKAKGNKAAIHDLILWSNEVAKVGREVQKKFLSYCINIIRQALLLNYSTPELVHSKIHVDNFELKKFAPFIHENNVQSIFEELEIAMLHVERNGNSRLIFTDLSIKLTRLLHTKAA
ncbi:MAG: DNA polymerase III subunit delta' [Bacteroidota bacterium]